MNQLNYIAIYNVRGISKSPASRHFQVWSAGGDSAYLTNDLSPIVEHLDRGAVIAHGLMTALFNGTEGEVRDSVASRVAEIQAERAKKYPSATFLVFHGIRDIPKPQLEHHREWPDFDVALDAIDKPDVREKFWPAIVRSLAAVALSLNDRADPRISKVTEGMFLLDPDTARPTYSFTITGGNVRVSIGTMLDDGAEDRIHHYAQRLREEKNIGRVLDQLIQSLAKEADEFRAFLTAWTALEIFVTSSFARIYEQRWFDLLRDSTPNSAIIYFEHVQQSMSSRHRLLDKFIVISSLLDPKAAEGDIAQFKNLKRIRDSVFHGSDDAGPHYPTDTAHVLLTKYIRLHLDCNESNPADQPSIQNSGYLYEPQ